MKLGLDKRDLGERLIGIMVSLGRKFLHPLAKSLEFGCYSVASHFGLFGLKEMPLLSTILGKMKRKCKETFGKVS
jgi:hypothetical protein